MKIEAGIKRKITNKQIDSIFKFKMLPMLNDEGYTGVNILNELHKMTPSIYVTVNNKERIVVYIGEEPNITDTHIMSNHFFDSQARGMAIAKANDKRWNNQTLLTEFRRGMKENVAKVFDKE